MLFVMGLIDQAFEMGMYLVMLVNLVTSLQAIDNHRILSPYFIYNTKVPHSDSLNK